MKKPRLGFPCQFCGDGHTEVLDTDRMWLERRNTKRRHECHNCGKRFNSHQISQPRYRKLLEYEEKVLKPDPPR
jgi:transcriptional regulator NrdR family protein